MKKVFFIVAMATLVLSITSCKSSSSEDISTYIGKQPSKDLLKQLVEDGKITSLYIRYPLKDGDWGIGITISFDETTDKVRILTGFNAELHLLVRTSPRENIIILGELKSSSKRGTTTSKSDNDDLLWLINPANPSSVLSPANPASPVSPLNPINW